MIPYEEIMNDIKDYISCSELMTIEKYRTRYIIGARWTECRNKLSGTKGISIGAFQKYRMQYLNDLYEYSGKCKEMRITDKLFVSSLLDLIHLTHTADNGSTHLEYKNNYEWERYPLDEAFQWLKDIYTIYRDDIRQMVKEYKDSNKMISDNIKIGYEEWATIVLSENKAIDGQLERGNGIMLSNTKEGLDSTFDEEVVKESRKRIMDEKSFGRMKLRFSNCKKLQIAKNYLDCEKWIWYGDKSRLILWLLGVDDYYVSKPDDYLMGHDCIVKVKMNNKNQYDWQELNGVFNWYNKDSGEIIRLTGTMLQSTYSNGDSIKKKVLEFKEKREKIMREKNN